MQNIRIESIKIKKEAVAVKFNYEETRNGITNIIRANKAYKFQMHDELSIALDKLKGHFILLTELNSYNSLDEISSRMMEETVAVAIEIKGLKYKSTGTVVGCYIEAQRTLDDGRVYTFETPFTNFDSDVSEYRFVDELVADVETVIEEMKAFINGKSGTVNVQLSLGDEPVFNVGKGSKAKKVA